MSELTPELADQIVAACQANADEVAGALTRSLDAEFAVAVGESASYDVEQPPEGIDGPGLAVMIKFGEVGIAALLPESSGLIPDWYSEPDTTGVSKLNTLAQELGMLLVPESLLAEDFQAARVDNLSAALSDAKVATETGLVPLELTVGEKSGELTVIWPVELPTELLAAATTTQQIADATPASDPKQRPKIEDFSQLPGYAQSLLKISLPVRVVLASKKENLQSVVELAPGSIIKFDKACDEMLHLQVDDYQVAVGEAVKVGDKFGFRVSSMVLPEEHFRKVRPRDAS